MKIAYLYAGPGVSRGCLEQSRAALAPYWPVETLAPDQLIEGGWEAKAALLVIPGGADVPYTRALNGAGNERIRAYVEQGGVYLGICAGGCYGGAYVEFARGSEIEVLGTRELAFFPGAVQGPILAPYEYNSESGALLATVRWGNDPFIAYYNGGSHFVDAEQYPQTQVLATYESGLAAIVQCKVGQGLAILSGVHFEYSQSDPQLLRRIVELIQPVEYTSNTLEGVFYDERNREASQR